MKLNGWLAFAWPMIAREVKRRLHQLVDSIDEVEISLFKRLLHEQIDRL